jgi:hypothetical protein
MLAACRSLAVSNGRRKPSDICKDQEGLRSQFLTYRAVRFSSFGPAQIGYWTLTIRPSHDGRGQVMSLPYPSNRLERPVAEIRGHSTRGSFWRELRGRRQDGSKGLLRSGVTLRLAPRM